ESESPARLEAVALVRRNDRVRWVGKTIKVDMGINRLELWRQRKLIAYREPLADFETDRFALAIVALYQGAEHLGLQVAVEPAEFCLSVHVETLRAVPREGCADTMAFSID